MGCKSSALRAAPFGHPKGENASSRSEPRRIPGTGTGTAKGGALMEEGRGDLEEGKAWSARKIVSLPIEIISEPTAGSPYELAAPWQPRTTNSYDGTPKKNIAHYDANNGVNVGPTTTDADEDTWRVQSGKGGAPRGGHYPTRAAQPQLTLSSAEKTDAVQAAEEYHKHLQAKREAQDAYKAKVRVDIFDSIFALHTFDVSHRMLLGRCWDRRIAELAHISFTHSTVASNPAGSDTLCLPPSAVISGSRGGGSPLVKEGGVPRRSHWFCACSMMSVLSLPTPSYSFSTSNQSQPHSPTLIQQYAQRHGFEVDNHAWTAPSALAGNQGSGGVLSSPLVLPDPAEIMKLPLDVRQGIFFDLSSRMPHFQGIKQHFAFRVSDDVDDGDETKFLRKRNLKPAYGIRATRWNRIELFHPNLHTLIEAVAKTEGVEPLSPIVCKCNISTAAGGGGVMSSSSLLPHLLPIPQAPEPCSWFTTSSFTGGVINNAILADDTRGTGGSSVALPPLLNLSMLGQHLVADSANESFVLPPHYMLGNLLSHNRKNHLGDSFWCASQLRSVDRVLRLNKSDQAHTSLSSGTYKHTEARFPEESVMSLALQIPLSCFTQEGSLAAVEAAHPSQPYITVGTPTPHASVLHSPLPTGLENKCDNWSACRAIDPPGSAPVFYDTIRYIALYIASFQVSINPFQWKELHYNRSPVDFDGDRDSAHDKYGEGFITDVMYGGIIITESNSLKAATALRCALREMKWTKARTMTEIIRDVRNYFKRKRDAKSQHKEPKSEDHNSSGEATFRYRITQRIGGRPMRDSVELRQILFFLEGDDVAPHSALPVSASENDGGVAMSHSAVDSVWMNIEAIAVVLRTWSMHLLCSPEYAQPVSFFLQKFAGVAQVLHRSVLPSDPDTHDAMDKSAKAIEAFFEDDFPHYSLDDNLLNHLGLVFSDRHIYARHQKPRVPRYNRFYASSSNMVLDSPLQLACGSLCGQEEDLPKWDIKSSEESGSLAAIRRDGSTCMSVSFCSDISHEVHTVLGAAKPNPHTQLPSLDTRHAKGSSTAPPQPTPPSRALKHLSTTNPVRYRPPPTSRLPNARSTAVECPYAKRDAARQSPPAASSSLDRRLRATDFPPTTHRAKKVPPPRRKGKAAVAAAASAGCDQVVTAAAPPTPPRGVWSEKEMETLWNIAMLEVRAEQSELVELRAARQVAEDHYNDLLVQLRTLQRGFLPNSNTQELPSILLYLKTALFAPEDLPASQVYLNHADWFPQLVALLTSPANAIFQTQVATPLTHRDLPKLGVVMGLLYHPHTFPRLQRLEFNASQLLDKPELHSSSKNMWIMKGEVHTVPEVHKKNLKVLNFLQSLSLQKDGFWQKHLKVSTKKLMAACGVNLPMPHMGFESSPAVCIIGDTSKRHQKLLQNRTILLIRTE